MLEEDGKFNDSPIKTISLDAIIYVMNKDLKKLRLFVDNNIALFKFSKILPVDDSKLPKFLLNEFCRKQILIEAIPLKLGGK